ncbi:hypothetical protein [Thioalkalivibrio nitratireducens]|uniref:hypothetical protein n=1 Tax=Thioalkalivibrio nitratireducens TaxID=186931 RepID=UPI0012ECF99E|nr:hypothetical protein [Thioalkalivibrio nitratireducens]
MSIMISSFLEMPFALKLMFIAGLLSPLLTLGATLTGSIIPSGDPAWQYGAAKNLFELFVIVGLMVPASISAILLARRWRSSRFLFVASYFIACVAPFSIESFREELHDTSAYVLAAIFTSVVILFYILFSRRVRVYFQTSSEHA